MQAPAKHARPAYPAAPDARQEAAKAVQAALDRRDNGGRPTAR